LVRKIDPRTGAAFWVLRYRDGVGRSVAMDLGPQPVISPMQALKLTGDCRFKPRRNAPARPERVPGHRSDTVAVIANRYLEYHAKPNSKSWAFTKQILERDVLPVWGSRAIGSIQRHEVHDLMDSIMDRGAPMMANRVLRAIRSVWNWGIDRGYIESSPLNGIKSPAREIPRDRVLKDEELLAIWRALDSFSWRFSSMVRLLMLTAQRRTEVAAAHWCEFDLRGRLWSIPRERMKAAAVHDVPLTEDVIELLHHLPRVPSSDYLFPATRGDGYCVAYSKAKSRLARASGVTD